MSENDPGKTEGQEGEQQSPAPKKPKLLFLLTGLVMAFFVMRFLGSFGGDDSEPQQQQAETSSEEEQVTAEDLGPIEIEDATSESAILTMEAQIDVLAQQVEETEEDRREDVERLERRIEEVDHRNERRFQELTELFQENLGRRARARREVAIPDDDRDTDYPDDLFADEFPDVESEEPRPESEEVDERSEPRRASDSDFPYERTARRSPEPRRPSPEEGFDDDWDGEDPFSGIDDSAPGLQFPMMDRDDRRRRSTFDDEVVEEPEETGPVTEERTIAALSYVRGRLLHGVSCPVAARGSATRAEDFLPAALSIQGDFRGPDGQTYNIGTPHAITSCFGYGSRKNPRARFNVEGLSMAWAGQDPQFLQNTPGYVMDPRDQQEGIAGILEEERQRALLWRSSAAGLARSGDMFSQSRGTTTETDDGRVIRSLDGGEMLEQGVGGAFAGAFDEIADAWRQRSEEYVDVVRVPAGTEVMIMFVEPIQYNVTVHEEEENGSHARPLL